MSFPSSHPSHLPTYLPTWKGFLSEDVVAKIKVLGKGEASLDKLAEYIPMENIPDFLGGPSKTTVGAADPLWAEIDAAISAWASGSDPFLDERTLRKISRRLRKERAARDDSVATAVAPPTSVTAEQPSISSVVGPGAIGASTVNGDVLSGDGGRQHVARRAKTSSLRGEEEGRGVLPTRLGDGQGTAEDDAKKGAVSAGGFCARNRRAGGVWRGYLCFACIFCCSIR